jgi:hypothetical protein
VLAVVDREKPIHLSIVGGDPVGSIGELEKILPELDARGIHTQVVTSAFRVIPAEWMRFKRLTVAVSIDGLQPEHDERRKPATYERILKSIAGAKVTDPFDDHRKRRGPAWIPRGVCALLERADPQIRQDLDQLVYSAARRDGARDTECGAAGLCGGGAACASARSIPSLQMPPALVKEILSPPKSPEECIFARTTHTLSADLKTKITPCQFGGDPDCSQCGCMASMALAAVGHYRVLGGLTAGHLFQASDRIGAAWKRAKGAFAPPEPEPESAPFTIL